MMLFFSLLNEISVWQLSYDSGILRQYVLIRSHTRPADWSKRPSPEVIKLFSCSTQLSMQFFLLINVKMPTNVGISTFISGKNSILDLPEPKKAEFLDIFILMSI